MIKKVVSLFFIFLLFVSNRGFALTLYTSSTEKELLVFEKLMKEISWELSIGVSIVPAPAERSLFEANEGGIDGDGLRVSGLDKEYKNLIMIPEKFLETEFVAITKGKDFFIKDWKSLKTRKVGFVIGWKILEKNVVSQHPIIKTVNYDQLFKMLENGRVEVIVYTKSDALEYIRKNNKTDLKILSPPLAKRGMYLYLNRKHKKLIPLIAASLRRIKKNGIYDKILIEVK